MYTYISSLENWIHFGEMNHVSVILKVQAPHAGAVASSETKQIFERDTRPILLVY